MRVLIGLSNGRVNENGPYKMLIADVDQIGAIKLEWKDLNAVELSKCENIRVNMSNYNPFKNPEEYIEAEFDINKLVNDDINLSNFQITNLYTNEKGEVELFRTVNSLGQVEMHDISEFQYKKKYCISGTEIDSLPSFIKREPLSRAYEWWKNKDEASKLPKNRFAVSNFETYEEMPVKLLYHYLIGVKGFELGYHTATDIKDKNSRETKHEYFLFNGTANIKLIESIPKFVDALDEIEIYGNNDPYPDKQKLFYYGATMSMICNYRNYPNFDWSERPNSQSNFDKTGVEVTIDAVSDLFAIYNKYENAKCISKTWRLGEYENFYGTTLTNLLPSELINLSEKLKTEKQRGEFGHWSNYSIAEWMKTMSLALCPQYYSANLRKNLNPILENYQPLFSNKTARMIESIGSKDALEVMKWAKVNVEEVIQNTVLIKEDGKEQEARVTTEQMNSLFTFKKNKEDLPDWLQIYSAKTIQRLGGGEYLRQLISARGEDSVKEFIGIIAEQMENAQRNEEREQKEEAVRADGLYVMGQDSLDNVEDDIDALTMKRAA